MSHSKSNTSTSPQNSLVNQSKMVKSRYKYRKKSCACRWSQWLDNDNYSITLDDNRYVNLPKKYKLYTDSAKNKKRKLAIEELNQKVSNTTIVSVHEFSTVTQQNPVSESGLRFSDLSVATIPTALNQTVTQAQPYNTQAKNSRNKRQVPQPKTQITEISPYDSPIPCPNPIEIQCRKKLLPNSKMSAEEQYRIPAYVICDKKLGLLCNSTKASEPCTNYEIRVQCCPQCNERMAKIKGPSYDIVDYSPTTPIEQANPLENWILLAGLGLLLLTLLTIFYCCFRCFNKKRKSNKNKRTVSTMEKVDYKESLMPKYLSRNNSEHRNTKTANGQNISHDSTAAALLTLNNGTSNLPIVNTHLNLTTPNTNTSSSGKNSLLKFKNSNSPEHLVGVKISKRWDQKHDALYDQNTTSPDTVDTSGTMSSGLTSHLTQNQQQIINSQQQQQNQQLNNSNLHSIGPSNMHSNFSPINLNNTLPNNLLHPNVQNLNLSLNNPGLYINPNNNPPLNVINLNGHQQQFLPNNTQPPQLTSRISQPQNIGTLPRNSINLGSNQIPNNIAYINIQTNPNQISMSQVNARNLPIQLDDGLVINSGEQTKIGNYGQIISQSSNGNTLTMYNPDDDEENINLAIEKMESKNNSSFRSLRGKNSIKQTLSKKTSIR